MERHSLKVVQLVDDELTRASRGRILWSIKRDMMRQLLDRALEEFEFPVTIKFSLSERVQTHEPGLPWEPRLTRLEGRAIVDGVRKENSPHE